jgi:tRNA pseudouridine38-40 synthase
MPKYTNAVCIHRACYRPKQRMQRWKTTLAYDGTAFYGWQIQPGLPTVQGTLSEALHRLCGEHVLPQGSGRTDTGVHALGQVASFALKAPIPAPNLHRALNRLLPSSIRVISLEPASPMFHARHSAVRKTYEYRIFLRRPLLPASAHSETAPSGEQICSPMLAPFVWDFPLVFVRSALDQAAAHVLGTHDFTSFAAADHDLASSASKPMTRRTIFESLWQQVDDLLLYRVTGNGFLHHMVRNLVGTFMECGCGRISPDQIPTILEARDRKAAGPTAPARGLFLVAVEYS